MATLAHNAQSLLKKIQALPLDRITEVEDFVDFLSERTYRQHSAPSKKQEFDFPVIRVDDWPHDLSLSREDMYGNDGR